jgi:hypothetical protein
MVQEVISSLSTRRPGFSHRLIHVGFAADQMAVGQRFSSVNIIPPMLHTHSFIYHQRHITLANDVIKQHADKKKVSIPKDAGWAWCPFLNTVMVSADVINTFCETEFYAEAYELRIQHLTVQTDVTRKCGKLLCNKEMFLKFLLNSLHIKYLIHLISC